MVSAPVTPTQSILISSSSPSPSVNLSFYVGQILITSVVAPATGEYPRSLDTNPFQIVQHSQTWPAYSSSPIPLLQPSFDTQNAIVAPQNSPALSDSNIHTVTVTMMPSGAPYFGVAMNVAAIDFVWRDDVIEGVTLMTLILSAFVSILSSAYPGEKQSLAKARCYSLVAVASLLCLVFSYKIFLDRLRDGASFLHYREKRDGKSVFYFKGLSHILGGCVNLCSLLIAVIQFHYFIDDNKTRSYDKIFIYWIGIAGMVTNFLYGATQTLKMNRLPCLAERRSEDGIIIVRPLRPCPKMPPTGRLDFYEINAEQQAFEMSG